MPIAARLARLSLFAVLAIPWLRVGTVPVLAAPQEQKLIASNGARYGLFGAAVAVEGDTAIIGAPEMQFLVPGPVCDDYIQAHNAKAYIFARSGGVWTQQAAFQVVGIYSQFGFSVALSGDTAVVGARGVQAFACNGERPGAVYIYVRSGSTWTPQASFSASSGFGASVGLSGDTLVVGSTGLFGAAPASVYTRIGTTWTLRTTLSGGSSNGVAIDGTTIVVSSGSTTTIHVLSGGVWVAQATLPVGGPVSISGDTVLVGGAVWVRSGGNWTQQAALGSSGAVDIKGDTAVVGLLEAALVYGRTGTTWNLQRTLTASDGVPGDNFGSSVATDGAGTVLVGAKEDDIGSEVNQGSVYVLTDPIVLPAAVATGVATAIGLTGATLNGLANPNGSAALANFDYGLTTGYGSATPAQALGSGNTAVPIGGGALTGLTCGTRYHFRATATNAAGTTNGLDATFTTPACPATVVTGVATAIGASFAVLNGTANPNGSPTLANFAYGLTTGYGSTTPVQDMGQGNVAVPFYSFGHVAGLACNTPYHFRAVATNAGGTSYGSDATFTTAACRGADFNSDGRSDVLWRNAMTGQNMYWLMNGMSMTYSEFLPTIGDTNWEVKGVGNFDDDSTADVVWRNKVTGQVRGWLYVPWFNATIVMPTIADTNWEIVGVGDFDWGAKVDTILRNKSTGQNVGWLMDGFTVVYSAFLPTIADTNWEVVGVGDLGGDGKTDVLWRNKATGQNIGWLMDGLTVVNAAFLPTIADTDWHVVGVGDVDGDRRADVLLRNSATGQDVGWLMDGLRVVNSAFLPTIADTDWDIKAIGDMNGDGRADVMWRHAVTGQNIVWLMNGLAVDNAAFLPTIADTNWEIVAPR